MPFNAARGVARDGLSISGERDRFDLKAGLLADLADDSFFQRLAEFDAAARQCVEAVGRRPRPPHDQYAPVAEDGSAHRQVGTRWISARSFVVTHQFPLDIG